MNLLNKTKQICKENNIKPARSRGQNFLINESVYDLIVDSAKIDKNNTVLEVGPGLGFLTDKLAGKAKKVIAVELDDKLAELLRANLKEKKIDNVEIVNENVLDINFKILNYKVVANLPYNITSVFLRKFLSCDNKPKSMVLMLQKEVAERIIAKPGKMSLLAVSVQFYAKAEIIEYVPRTNFWPVPAVDSAIITVGTGHRPVLIGEFEKRFFQLVKIGFSSKRKMLKNNLASGYKISQKQAENWLKNADFNEKIRAQEMSVDDWVVLLKKFGIFMQNMV